MGYYGTTFLQFSGLVLVALAVVGLVVVVRHRYLEALPWFTGVAVWVSLSTLPLTWARWGLPMWLTPLLLASVGLAVLLENLGTWRTRWIPVVASAVVALQLSAGAGASTLGLSAPDTRQAALAYTDAKGIVADQSVYEGYSPFLPGAPLLFFDQVTRSGDGYEFTTASGRPASYVVISSGMYNRVLADPSYAEEHDIYQWIFDHLEEVASFVPAESPRPSYFEPVSIFRNLEFAAAAASGAMSGPTIRIFEIPDADGR